MKDGRNSHLKSNTLLMFKKKLIKIFNNSKHNALGLLKNDKGEYCQNPEDSLNILLNKFFPGHTNVPDTDTIQGANNDWAQHEFFPVGFETIMDFPQCHILGN